MSNKYTKEEILEIVEKEDVRFIRCQFTDIFGTLKNIVITRRQLPGALEDGIMFDGSSINGFVRIHESDMILKPDINTFALLPWCSDDNKPGNKTARVICDVYTAKGEPFEGDPRYVLKKVLKKAADMGYTMNVGPEMEFYLFKTDEQGRPTSEINDQSGYFDLGPIDKGDEVRRDISLALEDMGFEIEATHHESASGQHEIDFRYSDALTTADRIMTFKLVSKAVALGQGFYPSFMPKPKFGAAGNGMHCNQSLYKDGENAFYDANDPNKLSKEAYHYMAGLLKHARGFAAITNPIVNSYKRLVIGYEAPVYLAWSKQNRSPLVRIPDVRHKNATRIELRNPDPSCNPYLAFAVMLAAGLEGIEKKLEAPEPIDMNIYELTPEDIETRRLESLPKDLAEAVKLMQEDELMHETLGSHIMDYYCKAKMIEWQRYYTQVHPWELEEYLLQY